MRKLLCWCVMLVTVGGGGVPPTARADDPIAPWMNLDIPLLPGFIAPATGDLIGTMRWDHIPGEQTVSTSVELYYEINGEWVLQTGLHGHQGPFRRSWLWNLGALAQPPVGQDSVTARVVGKLSYIDQFGVLRVMEDIRLFTVVRTN